MEITKEKRRKKRVNLDVPKELKKKKNKDTRGRKTEDYVEGKGGKYKKITRNESRRN